MKHSTSHASIFRATPSLWQILLAIIKRITPQDSPRWALSIAAAVALYWLSNNKRITPHDSPRWALSIAAAVALYWLSNNKRKTSKKEPEKQDDHTSNLGVEPIKSRRPYQPKTPPILFDMISRQPNADYRVYPTEILTQALEGCSKTIGDLHGNTMKLLWDLIYSGIVSGINRTDYQNLYEIYKAVSHKNLKKLSKQQADDSLSQFSAIINNITLSTQPALLRFIGDVLCDRGSNDTLTLLLLDKLDQLGLPIRILLSNHDMAFFQENSWMEKSEQGASQLAMLLLLNSRPRLKKTVNRILKKYSSHWLYLVDCELNTNDTVTIYTHTLVTQDTLRELAKLHNTKWHSDTAQSILASCQRLNSAFKNEIENSGDLTMYFSKKFEGKTPEMILQSPPYQLTWNRDIQETQSTEANFPEHCYHIYGHNGAYGMTVESNTVKLISQCIDDLCSQPNSCTNFNILVCLLQSQPLYQTPIIYYQCLHKILHYLEHVNPYDGFIRQLQKQYKQLEKWIKEHHLHQTVCIDSDKGKLDQGLNRDKQINDVFEEIQEKQLCQDNAIFSICHCIFIVDPLWAINVAITLFERNSTDRTLPHINCVSQPSVVI